MTSPSKDDNPGVESGSASRTDNRLPLLSIPKRTSSKRSAAWNGKFADRSTEDLEGLLDSAQIKIERARKRLKNQSSTDAEHWESCIEIYDLQREQVLAASQADLRLFEAEDANKVKNWYEEPKAENMELQYHGWMHLKNIAQRQARRLRERAKADRRTFVRVYVTSLMGLNLDDGMGSRDASDQSGMVRAMIDAYCPNPIAENYRWCPVTQLWHYSTTVHAAHLFPWRQSHAMDDIFGPGAKADLFSPVNGLFLHAAVEDALDKGLIALVPDVDLDPRNPQLPQVDEEVRRDRIRTWERQPVKDYKIIVLNRSDRRLKKIRFIKERDGFATLLELHERKLVFKTDARPRAQYVWWTFMNAVMRVVWSQGSKNINNLLHEEVQKGTRYWGTRRAYVKRNQLLGFVEELGQDVKSILDVGSDTEDEGGHDSDDQDGPAFEAISAMAGEVVEKSAVALVHGDDDYYDECGENRDEYDDLYIMY